MKKNINIFISICLLIGTFTGCSDLLDSPAKSSLEDDVIFSNVGLSQGVITAILQSFGETNSYRGRLIHYYGTNTDIEWYNSSESTSDARSELTGYAGKPNNQRMDDVTEGTDPWSKIYEAIERANIAIRGFENYGDVDNNADLGQLYGEALTLRALLYYDLIKFWGDVPARFEPVSNETIYVGRTNREVIFKQLIGDLEIAANYLAWPNETSRTSTVENVNKAFAKGLRARVCLMAAGHFQRYTGEITQSNDPELTKENLYPIVKKECLDILNSQTSRLGSFEQNFRNLCEEVLSAGNESLWEIPFSNTRGQVMYGFSVKHEKTTEGAGDPYVQVNQGGIVGPIPTLYYEYDQDDIRRDITCLPYKWESGIQIVNKISQWYFGKYRYEWMKRVVTSDDDGINWQVMRLADIYLMAAEVINELEGPANAAPYLEAIRNRAFPDNPEKVTAFMQTVTVSKDAFFEAIVQERALEFAGEMLRKADLIRWNRLKTSMDETKVKLYALQKQEGDYADLNTDLYYRLKEDKRTIELYGLQKGELGEPTGGDWVKSKEWFLSEGGSLMLKDDKIESIYQRNPDQYQYWPIFGKALNGSNNTLTNEINYYAN